MALDSPLTSASAVLAALAFGAGTQQVHHLACVVVKQLLNVQKCASLSISDAKTKLDEIEVIKIYKKKSRSFSTHRYETFRKITSPFLEP